MSWIGLAVGGYFLGAVVLITDKFLIASNRIARPAGYAFLTACASLFVLILALFDVAPTSWMSRGLSLASGVSFIYGVYFLFVTLKAHRVSTVAPIVGMISAAVALLPSLVASIVLPGEWHHLLEIFIAFALFLFGGFLVAFDLPLNRRAGDLRWHSAVFSGVLLAFSYLILKFGYVTAGLSFVDSVVWSRIGFFLGGLSFLLFPILRSEIIATWQDIRQPKHVKTTATTGVIFFANKAMAGIATFLVNGAIFLGPVGIVQAMDGLRFAFVFLFACVLSRWYPGVFCEKLSWRGRLQKLVAFALLSIGIWMATQITANALPFLS